MRRHILEATIAALPDVANVLAVCFVFFMIFAIFAVGHLKVLVESNGMEWNGLDWTEFVILRPPHTVRAASGRARRPLFVSCVSFFLPSFLSVVSSCSSVV